MSDGNTQPEVKQKMKNTLLAPILTTVVFLMLILSNFIDTKIIRYRDNLYLSVIILQLLIFIIPGIFYSKLKGPGYVNKLNFRLFGMNGVIFIAAIFLALICGDMIIKLAHYAIGIYRPQITHFDKYLQFSVNSTDAPEILYVILAYVLLPAISEEFLFRGIVLTEYNVSGAGSVNTVILTALLYAMLYFDFLNFPIHFLNGIVFGLAVFVTRSVMASIIMHAMYNLFGLFAETYMMRLASHTGNLTFYVFILITGIFIFTLFALGNAEKIYYGYSADIDEAPERYVMQGNIFKRFSEAAISPSYLICVILFVASALDIHFN